MFARFEFVFGRDSETSYSSSVVVKDRLGIEHIEAESSETSTLGHQQAFGTRLWNLDLGRDAVGTVLKIRCSTLRDAYHAGIVGEGGAAVSQTGTVGHIQALYFAVVQR